MSQPGYHFTLYPDGRMLCRLGHEVPPGEEDAHLHHERGDTSRAEGLARLLEAVDALPARHDCGGRLSGCDDHPGWRVFRRKYGTEWNAIPPGPETFPTPAEHLHDSWAAAHGQVRAVQLAAIESSEGAGR